VLIADLALRPEAQDLVSAEFTKQYLPARAIFLKTDVSSWKDLSAMFTVAEKEFGKIDIVCPGAGVFEPLWSNFWRPPGTEESKDKVDGDRYAMLDINITHPIRTTQLAISYFLAAAEKEGKKTPFTQDDVKSIVHISSIAGQSATLPTPMYHASKWAVSGFVRSMAPLEEELGIRIVAVSPGIVKTPLWTDHPEKLQGSAENTVWVTPEEVAEVMLAVVEGDEVRSIIGGKDGEGELIKIAGGSILEVSARAVRDVYMYNDPGPGGRPGNDLENMGVLYKETWELVKTPGWGQ
jgi:3-hydroxybutyrate dehydrogenase